MHFNTAQEVRKHLKDNGITEKFKVRWFNSPFGGPGAFYVTFTELKGAIVYSYDSATNVAKHYGDEPESVSVLAKAAKLLEGTNARVG